MRLCPRAFICQRSVFTPVSGFELLTLLVSQYQTRMSQCDSRWFFYLEGNTGMASFDFVSRNISDIILYSWRKSVDQENKWFWEVTRFMVSHSIRCGSHSPFGTRVVKSRQAITLQAAFADRWQVICWSAPQVWTGSDPDQHFSLNGSHHVDNFISGMWNGLSTVQPEGSLNLGINAAAIKLTFSAQIPMLDLQQVSRG